MTLNEAITRFEEIADYHKNEIIKPCESIHRYFANNVCYHATCEKEYRQLAEWLKELKALKIVKDGANCSSCAHDGTGDIECRDCNLSYSGYEPSKEFIQRMDELTRAWK